MRCLSCENISFHAICKTCQKNLLKPSFYKREIEKDFFVYSFYQIDEIKEFINSKYHFFGDRVYKILGSLAFKKFAESFEYDSQVFALPIDDHTRHQFSHTAILARSLKSKNITPMYQKLKANNIVKYAGKDLSYRKNNKRDFEYLGDKGLDIILVDDVVTTGTTLLEAKSVLEIKQCNPLFALTLCDAKDKNLIAN
jgi:competence protein ComFC